MIHSVFVHEFNYYGHLLVVFMQSSRTVKPSIYPRGDGQSPFIMSFPWLCRSMGYILVYISVNPFFILVLVRIHFADVFPHWVKTPSKSSLESRPTKKAVEHRWYPVVVIHKASQHKCESPVVDVHVAPVEVVKRQK